MKSFRPSAVPLITVDPYFSIWSMSDHLYDDVTHHWTGRRNPMSAAVKIDGNNYILMGEFTVCSDRTSKCYEQFIPQTALTVTPTKTHYLFANDIVEVSLLFTTPLLLDRLDIMTRPASYIEYDIKVLDGKEHDITFYFDISAECCIDSYEDSIVCGKTAHSVYCGKADQTVLSKSGDSICIDWGYLHVADKDARVVNGWVRFQDDAKELEPACAYKVFQQYPYISLKKKELHGVITVAYDDITPISYLGEKLEDYYKKFFKNFDAMLEAAVKEYSEISALCSSFDEQLMQEALAFGEKYEKLASLAYRQAIAAHKLVEDKHGKLLFLSKECHSNGCIGTLDVTYPSIPLFLKYNPELVKGMLRPILDYAQTDMWPFDFAPHDVGQYPLADGQVYGMNADTTLEQKLKHQMPVEECGNMLLCVAGIAKAEGEMHSCSFAQQNQAILKQWADYLVKYGYDPGNQLCTDDFAGHLAHNCNLSLKAILGIAAYGLLFDASEYLETAAAYAHKWEADAAGKEGTRLAFDKEASWSLKYNIVWDRLLGLKLFSDSVFEKEIQVYRSKMNRYGTPLDNRSDYTKLDWLMWTTIMTDDKTYFEEVCDCLYRFVDETPNRVPISDWYYSTSGGTRTFQNRSVLGGLYMPMLFK